MSIGAEPLDTRGVRVVIDRKMADFRSVARRIELRHLDLDDFLDVARAHPDVRFHLESGFIDELETQWRDPVLADVDDRRVLTCPPLAIRVLAEEPPEIHRAFVEGAFFRKLFRFFVPAAHEGGQPWEAVEQVRGIMQRHFALQLVVTETLLDRAA